MADFNLGMDLYDFNKQAYAQEEPLDVISLNIKVNRLVKDLYSTKQPYWMLLCKERSDYTVFIMLTKEGTVTELLETLQNRGQVLDIQKLEDGNYEIWIRDPDTKENFAYYFFDYSFGIVKA